MRSLNCGQGSKDDSVAVVENRALVARHLGSPGDDVQTLHQVHSATALVVDTLVPARDAAQGGRVSSRRRVVLPSAFSRRTARPSFSPTRKQGWLARRMQAGAGRWAGVLEATVAAMESIGADRKRIHAALGPSIGPKSYEVGPEFEAEFLASDPANSRFFRRVSGRDRPYFDLPGFVNHGLSRLGIRSVESRAHCTYENESLFFSFRRSQHRKEPDYGRQISAIVVT